MKTGRILIAVFVVLGSVALAAVIVATRPRPEQTAVEDPGILVSAVPAERVERTVDVEAQGTVMAAEQVAIQPQVPGRIDWISARLAPGAVFRRGERLFTIEDDDFELALESAKASLQEAEAQLALEEGRRRVAEREWELFGDEIDPDEQDSSLALREPQLRSARARVESARAAVARAELDLRRTEVRAPFNALVLSESIDVGQTVSPQSQAMTLVGTDVFWVRASVPLDELGLLRDAGVGAEALSGLRALIHHDTGGVDIRRAGRVVRLLGDVDPAGRMARLLIEVPDPLALREDGSEAPGGPLLLSSYVDVTLRGERREEVFPLARAWIRDGASVWVLDDGRLEIRPVEVAWRLEEEVMVRNGLREGELVVTSRIASPIAGMKLRRGDGARSARPEGELEVIEAETSP